MRERERITSRDNRRLINAGRVRDGKANGQIFVEGRRLVEEALLSRLVIEECFVAESFRDRELLQAVRKRAAVAEIPDSLFNSLCDTVQPQGIIVIAKRPEPGKRSIESGLETPVLPVVLFLNEINNPSNLGAILRTAEAAGVTGVIISPNSADVYSPKALRAAMGASFRLPVWENAEFDEVEHWAKGFELVTTATSVSATLEYTQVDWKEPRLLIFGSEAHGLDGQLVKEVNLAIRIPMESKVESLNLAVSAGIMLFEARRQNTHK